MPVFWFVSLTYILCFCIALCIVSRFVYSCLFPIFVQVYRPLPPRRNPTAVNKCHIKRVIPAKRTGCATESLHWKTHCHRVRSEGPWQSRWSSSPCIQLGWSQRRATRLTRTTASEAHNEREDNGMEETKENQGSDGDPIFMRKTMCFKTEKFLVQVYGLRREQIKAENTLGNRKYGTKWNGCQRYLTKPQNKLFETALQKGPDLNAGWRRYTYLICRLLSYAVSITYTVPKGN
jgi:hypothetical protein